MSEAMINVLKLADHMLEIAEAQPDDKVPIKRLLCDGAQALIQTQNKYARECDIVTNLVEDRDSAAFVFTARIKALCDEFEGKLSTAAAIGAFEIVKHELIAEALEGVEE